MHHETETFEAEISAAMLALVRECVAEAVADLAARIDALERAQPRAAE